MNLTDIGDIGVEYTGVTSVVSDVSALYDKLRDKIDNLNKRKDAVSDYWKSQEASNFVSQMDVVSGYFNDFSTHYSQFIELLLKVLDLYEQEEESIIAVLQKYAGTYDASR